MLFCEDRLSAADNSVFCRIVLGNQERKLLSDILGEVLLEGIGNLACRNEYLHAVNFRADTALVARCDRRCNNRLVIESVLNDLAGFLLRCLLVGHDDFARLAVDLHDLDLYSVALMKCARKVPDVIGVSGNAHMRVVLVADAHDRLIRSNTENSAIHHFAHVDVLRGLLEQLAE